MKIKVFISSVQKELADERLAIQILLTTDPFLSEHSIPILFEDYPASLKPADDPYLKLLDSCQIYLCIIWKEYGAKTESGFSAMHMEYKRAQENRMPMLIAIKGANTIAREAGINKLIEQIKKDKHTYERFESTEELQRKVRNRLINHFRSNYYIEPTSAQEEVARNTIQVASSFERQRLDRLSWDEMSGNITKEFVSKAEEIEISNLTNEDIVRSLWQRGYLWRDNDKYYGTAAGILMFGFNPSVIFPQARIQIAAYADIRKTPSPFDHDTIKLPLSNAIDRVVAFINKNTRHPLRVVGLERIVLNEYPEEAIREALVNAVAHRNYEDAGRRIEVNVFKDRIEITSPGGLPGGLALKKLLSGQAKSRSRNPNIAQGLSLLGRMEERGTGIQRMRDAMLNHGLDKPEIKLSDGEVIVILKGPGDDMDRIKTPALIATSITPAVEDRLNKRQKEILIEIAKNGSATTAWCIENFGVVKDTARRDFKELVELGVLTRVGKGRNVKYIRTENDR